MAEKKALLREELMIIPTYEMGEEERLPVFDKVKINQGTKGLFYPYKSNDRLTMQMNDKHEYRAITMENDYIRVVVLPELGGRIYEGYDKVNDYHFVYKNNVIKPALIGLNGVWSSGGIEFNWPQHHRPSTWLPLEHATVDNEPDGSVTAWVGETEAMNGLKCLLGVSIHPEKAYITAKAKIYNPSTQKHPFHWWANLAVHVDDSYRLMFPPDIDYITFHNKTHVSEFPVIKGEFAGFDFGEGLDIRNYGNIEAASSYFIFDSQYNFMAGYNDNLQMGTVHVADKYISPGKKFFTWGHSGYSEAWQSNLTDDDGDYIEIMTGCYTDNQPDFTWIMPQETKTFEQHWYSINGLQDLKNASNEAAVSIVEKDGGILVQFNVTEAGAVTLCVNGERTAYDAVPGVVYEYATTAVKAVDDAVVAVMNADDVALIYWKKLPMFFDDKEVPQPRLNPEKPEDIASVDELYANGMHLEQYKSPLLTPDPYYLEIIKRDPGDLRANTAMGILKYRKGEYEAAVPYLETAVKRVTCRNPNPYDSDCYYQLGLVYRQLGDNKKALPLLKRAAWQYAYKSAALAQCAEIEIINGDYEIALKDLDIALEANYHSIRIRGLKAMLLCRLGRKDEAIAVANETIAWDILATSAYFAKALCGCEAAKAHVVEMLGTKTAAYIDLAETCASAGLYAEALEALALCPIKTVLHACYVEYAKAQMDPAYVLSTEIDKAPMDEIFPNRTFDYTVLNYVTAHSNSAWAPYYVGCMYFNGDVFDKTVAAWQLAIKRDPSFADAHRALAIAMFEGYGDIKTAKAELELAMSLGKTPRMIYEYFQFLKVGGATPEELIAFYEANREMAETRQEVLLQYLTLLDQVGRAQEVADYMADHQFYTYEGGEGETTQVSAYTHITLGNAAAAAGDTQKALSEYLAANAHPENYHEGPRYQESQGQRFYFIAKGHKLVGDQAKYEEALALTMSQYDSNSESQFFKGLAFKESGNYVKAAQIFNALKDKGASMIGKDEIEYFLNFPAPLPYEQSQTRFMTKFGNIALALGCIGLGETEKAQAIIAEMDAAGMPAHWLKLALEEMNG